MSHRDSGFGSRPRASPGAPSRVPVPEDELRREMVFVLQGCDADTTHCLWDNDAQRYVLRHGTERQRSQIAVVQRCGALQRQIKGQLSQHVPSFLQQSLRKAIERQLQSYALYIAALQDQQPLTYGDIEVACRRAEPRLQAMASILTACSSDVKGGELVTRLEPLQHHGAPDMASFLGEVYREAVGPLLGMTVQWATKGAAADPFEEFFVRQQAVDRATSRELGRLWSHRFTLRREMLPATIGAELAAKVLLVGKNINFIHRCCLAKSWRMAPAVAEPIRNATFETLAASIDAGVAHTNAAVMRLLRTEYAIAGLFAVCRTLFLLSSGDLYCGMVDRLEPLLARAVGNASQQELDDAVQAVLHEYAPFLGPSVTNAIPQVVVELDRRDVTRPAAECFFLSLRLGAPFNTVVDDDALGCYQRLFHVLWKTKRAEEGLKAAWRHCFAFDRKHYASDEATRRLRQLSTRLFQNLAHFVRNVQSYMMTEVTEHAWKEFNVAFDACASLDELLAAHRGYLQHLHKHALLDEAHRPARDEINSVLNVVLSFGSQTRHLDRVATAADVRAASEAFARAEHSFERHTQALLDLMEQDPLGYDFLLPLGSRLNFNHYFGGR